MVDSSIRLWATWNPGPRKPGALSTATYATTLKVSYPLLREVSFRWDSLPLYIHCCTVLEKKYFEKIFMVRDVNIVSFIQYILCQVMLYLNIWLDWRCITNDRFFFKNWVSGTAKFMWLILRRLRELICIVSGLLNSEPEFPGSRKYPEDCKI